MRITKQSQNGTAIWKSGQDRGGHALPKLGRASMTVERRKVDRKSRRV